ncbi:MAG: glycosyltransferase family 4 protein, partial [bacterium]|nr:glycosyltransferase family 4 protein [bacterium]
MSKRTLSARFLIGMPAPDSIGGPISSEPPLVDALRSKGLDVVAETYVYGDKLTPTPFFQRVKRVLRTAFRFRKLVREHRPSVIFLNSAFDKKTILRDSASLFLMGLKDSKVFIKLHGSMAEDFESAGFPFRQLIGYLQKKVDAFGYHTREELEAFARLGFDRKKFFPVRNAVTIHDDLPADHERPRKEADEIFDLLFAARFVPTKGLLPTILACEELRKRGVRFRLKCVGDGETSQEAKDAVGRLALGRVVTFTGQLPEADVTTELLNADIFVFPTSHPEGFPNALFKAVATGLPVVTTNIRAAADYLSDPQNCLYCTTDPANIADRI